MFKSFFALCLTVLWREGALLSNGDGGDLLAVVVVFRHGARTIVEPYPNDPYRNESMWPVGFGQLTNEGKMQHYALGQYFRDRYDGFLPTEYSEKVIYVRSTDVDRTLMSAAANLAGLYPPSGRQVWDSEIPWQPIPIHTEPEHEDPLLAFKKPCARYDVLYDELMRSDEIVDINRANGALYAYLNEHSGANISDFDQMEYLYNTLTVERANNFTLPEWTRSVFPDKMKALADLSFALPCYTAELARFKTGPFFHDLIGYFEGAMKNPPGNHLKMKMFSGHDTTVANILESLRIFEYHSPPYTSTVVFELRKNGTDSFVNVLYKNSSVPQRMVLKGCRFDCPLDEFVKLVAPLSITLNEWKRECKVSLLATITESRQNLIITAVLAVLTVCVIAVLVKFAYSTSKKDRTIYLRLPDDEEQV